jgi:hypothetical protein
MQKAGFKPKSLLLLGFPALDYKLFGVLMDWLTEAFLNRSCSQVLIVPNNTSFGIMKVMFVRSLQTSLFTEMLLHRGYDNCEGWMVKPEYSVEEAILDLKSGRARELNTSEIPETKMTTIDAHLIKELSAKVCLDFF